MQMANSGKADSSSIGSRYGSACCRTKVPVAHYFTLAAKHGNTNVAIFKIFYSTGLSLLFYVIEPF